MSAFDKVIGYETIKNELKQICDMIHNKEIYTALGAKLPRGVLLHGEPGLGKSLMAKCFIEESGLPAYTVRRNKGGEEFMQEISEAFRKAAENAPAVVFLDDMDKFANEEQNGSDAEQYVAVQTGIDETQDSGVFVIATANRIWKLPKSLVRAGRFDRNIEVECPGAEEAGQIIGHYLKNKNVAEDLDLDDVVGMISYKSCAELETIINEAAVQAAYARRSLITITDIMETVLRRNYEVTDITKRLSGAEGRRIAIHEAGHLVIGEVLDPGSVGMASLLAREDGKEVGFVRACKHPVSSEQEVLSALGGKAAMELYCADERIDGCKSDLAKASELVRNEVSKNCACGFGVMGIETDWSPCYSENLNARNEAVVHAELERYLRKARSILLRNRAFLERTAEALLEKGTLLRSDIRALRESTAAADAAV